mgnify:CR=1 FL=1
MLKKLLPLILLYFTACKEKNQQVESSVKSITSVGFKKADNPSLTADINGNVSKDSIQFDIPPHIAVNNLVPTIDFSGRSIEPTNKKAQDFTNSIVYKVTAEDGSTKSFIFSVTRTLSDTPSLVLGSWKLVKDSVTNNNWIHPSNVYLIPGVYTGTALDYYRFENGLLYARTNNVSGPNAYTIAGNKLDVPVWTAQYGHGTIETLNTLNFVFYFADTSANGGRYFRKVYLKR